MQGSHIFVGHSSAFLERPNAVVRRSSASCVEPKHANEGRNLAFCEFEFVRLVRDFLEFEQV